VPAATTQSPPVEPARRQRADARRNRQKVIEAARACMARDGLDAQMDEIARAAGVGVGTVYRHFPTKDELVRGLAADRFARLADLAHEALAGEDPWDSFCDLIRRSGAIQSDDRALSEVLVSRPETMREAADAVGMLELVGEIMRRAQATGDLRSDAEPEDVPMLMCALAGAFHNPMTNADRYIGIVLDGLRAPGATKLPPRS
jgi:AcrR family transcriptional regulator